MGGSSNLVRVYWPNPTMKPQLTAVRGEFTADMVWAWVGCKRDVFGRVQARRPKYRS